MNITTGKEEQENHFKSAEEFDNDLNKLNDELKKGDEFLRTTENLPLSTLIEKADKQSRMVNAYHYILALKQATYPPPRPPFGVNGKGGIIQP